MMNTYIALLRGINVGGHRKITMVELRSIFQKMGLRDIKTYIQCGNVVFCSSMEDTKVLEMEIKNAILHCFGFDIAVIVRTKQRLKRIFDLCPFDDKIAQKSYFAILSQTPNKILVKEASQKSYQNEYYYITDDCIYFYSGTGYSKSKFNLNFFERKLKISATARNYKTMLKLIAMADETESNA